MIEPGIFSSGNCSKAFSIRWMVLEMVNGRPQILRREVLQLGYGVGRGDDFQGLIQTEGSQSGVWFVPDEILI